MTTKTCGRCGQEVTQTGSFVCDPCLERGRKAVTGFKHMLLTAVNTELGKKQNSSNRSLLERHKSDIQADLMTAK